MARPKLKEDATMVRCFLSTRLVINAGAYKAGLTVPDYLQSIFPYDENTKTVGEFKPCHACKEIKPVKEFYKSKASPDGYASSCKKCQLGLTVVQVKK
jgi:hypothetical protein